MAANVDCLLNAVLGKWTLKNWHFGQFQGSSHPDHPLVQRHD